MAWGKQFGCYLRAKEPQKIDKIVEKYPEIYNSRNSFIRSAVEFLIRFYDQIESIPEESREGARLKFLRMEELDGKFYGNEAADEERHTGRSE